MSLEKNLNNVSFIEVKMKKRVKNKELSKLISELRKYKKPIWKAVAEKLNSPRRRKVCVNVSKINRYTNPNDIVVVPGKVLGCGELEHPVTIGAFKASEKAKEKIKNSKGKLLSISELAKKHPKGTGIKIIV